MLPHRAIQERLFRTQTREPRSRGTATRPIPFGHIGDGNIHFNLSPPPGMPAAQFIECWPALVAAVEAIALALGGSISAEHGIGRAKREALRNARSGTKLEMMRALKEALDPRGLLNPDKLL